MTTVTFTQHLRRLVGSDPIQVDAATLGGALDEVFQELGLPCAELNVER